MAQLLISLITLGRCLSANQLFQFCMSVTNVLKSTMSITLQNNDDVDITSIIDEYNLECLIHVVTNLSDKAKIKYEDKNVDSALNDSQYVIIETRDEFLKSLEPDQIVIYYLCDSLVKINELLNQVNKKNDDYKNSYIALRKPNFKIECTKLISYTKQLKERVELYKTVRIS
jgi:hypothetical protein